MIVKRKGALVDSQDTRGRTPLSYAAEQRHIVVLRQLLAGGAQVGWEIRRGKRHWGGQSVREGGRCGWN